MKPDARRSPLLFLIAAALRQIARRPYLSLSVAAHAALLALAYYFGTYQMELRQQEADVASSLRATSVASTVKRLQDLQTIKQLLEKSANRDDTQTEPSPAPETEPQTPEEMVERARELSAAIETLDQEIRAEELAELTGVPKPPPAAEPAPVEPTPVEPAPAAVPEAPVAGKPDLGKTDARQADARMPPAVTQEKAASEVAALEAKARATLARRQQRLEARANGVHVDQGTAAGTGEQTTSGAAAAPRAKGDESLSAVRAEMADFIGAGEGVEEKNRSTAYAGLEFFDRGTNQIPPVDVTSLVRGQGRMLGAGGEYANRVYLNSWYIIGPFPGRHGGDLYENPSYPPGKAVLLDAVYFGKGQRLLKWQYVTAQDYPLYPPDAVEDSVYYGYTEVFVDQASDLTAWIGSDDDVQIYLNDHLVWKGGNIGKQSYFDAVFNPNTDAIHVRDYNRTEGKRVVHFNRGRNRLFFKLSNGPNLGYVSMVLTR
jgi:hypothetical protein